MPLDDRFDELVDSLTGFQRTWLVYLGVELGLLSRLRTAGRAGLSPEQLAADRGCRLEAIDAWARASDAHRLVTIEDGLIRLDEDTAIVLLDDDRPEFIGGQFVHSVIASLDWGGMLEFFRTGQPITDRPDRYRASIERLTVQDIAVFFQEALAELPQLVADLSRGGRVVDIHCGGGRWLIAMARRFPDLELVGVEFEPDSVARARANVVAAGLAERIEIREAAGRQGGSGSRVRPRVLPIRPAPAVRSRRRAAGRLGGAAAGRPDRRARLAAALDAGRVPDAVRRADQRCPAG